MLRKTVMSMVLVFILTLALGLVTAQAKTTDSKTPAVDVMTQAIGSAAKEADNSSSLATVTRKQINDNIYEYTMVIKVGKGQYDKIGIHRIVKEESPWVPIAAEKAVMMIHGDSCNFNTAFGTIPGQPASDSLSAFLAQKGVDVWGIDLRWTFVPDTATDFSFMKKWDTSRHIKDIKLAVKFARAVRALTGSGHGKIFMLGHSRGAQFLYAYANRESQLPEPARDLKGIIPMDMVYKFSPADSQLAQAALERYQAYKSLYDSGTYVNSDGQNLKGLAWLTASDPDGISPIIPGFTNKQAALSVLTATYATYQPLQPITPFYHYLAGTFDENGFPDGLQYVEQMDKILGIALASPSFQSMGEIIDGEAIISGAVDVPYDDHLADIKLPVLYVGAAGGMGEYGVYTTTLLGSSDVTVQVVTLLPAEAKALDYGHADLIWADNAEELVWEPIYNWLELR
ncbi:Alpha/beta hydrolase family protein [Pelotomaculum schinkii]|uniref:Alpha/beta hydrolase family protein n=1 Tax=Pelotomaculum schinkii TaxID=78350 RepID=A0A4Y7REX1_9FIRM|nr:hypothetical protein [Pelotomaculum schinkii]TEB07548.1 Alpha/beta hydrolase family protein [Pelotomaculum schinkii]